MKQFPRSIMVICLSGLVCTPAAAQLIPDIAPALQVITDRQAERAQQQAAERALQQVEAVQQRVVEQATQQQAETVQSQTLERVAGQVERAQDQALERAQGQALERAQGQVADQAQSRVEQVQGQIGRAQGQIQRVQERVAEQALERSAGLPGGLIRAADVPTLPPAAGGVLAQADAVATGNGVPVTDRNGNQAFVEITLPDGARAIAFEWIMLVTTEQRTQLDGEAAALMGFLSGTRPFALGTAELLTFSVPPDLDANEAILELVPPNLRGQIDRNHLYAPRDDKRPRWLRALTGDKAPAAPQAGAARAAGSMPLPLPLRAVCEAPLSIGMVDAQVDLQHAVFSGLGDTAARVVSQSFVEAELDQSAQHGTAVAALWLGRYDADAAGVGLRPLLPGATLYNATVFHVGENVQEGASALRILAALDWLSQQESLHVINMSLAGPPNRLLEQTINTLHARGTYVVAAMGNDGPHGPPRYPAAYANVLAVAAADRDGEIYRWSNQGEHVDYTALGVDLPTAAAEGEVLAAQSGTSLAAPVVAAFLACALEAGQELDAALASLDARVLDLGDPGTDPVYGKGLLHPW